MIDYTIRTWEKKDLGELIALWQTVFGDPEDYIRSFQQHFLKENNCVLAEADGKVVSAIYYLPGMSVNPCRNNTLTAGYTYSLGTLPAYRGHGIGTEVFRAANAAILKNAELGCVLPAEESLYPFYRAATGARPLSSAREARFTAEELSGLPRDRTIRIPFAYYLQLRQSALTGMPHADYSEEYCDFLEEQYDSSPDAGFFMSENGIAFAEMRGDTCFIPELLTPGRDGMTTLAAVAAYCPAKNYIVRTPLFFNGPGKERHFMLAAFRSEPEYAMPDDLWWGFGLE